MLIHIITCVIADERPKRFWCYPDLDLDIPNLEELIDELLYGVKAP